MPRRKSPATPRVDERAIRLAIVAREWKAGQAGKRGSSLEMLAAKHGFSPMQIYRAAKRGHQSVKMGRPSLLTAAEEEQLARIVRSAQKACASLTRDQALPHLLEIIKARKAAGKPHPWEGQVPSNKWWAGFQLRHDLSLRKAVPLTKKRREAAQQQADLERWFTGVWEPALSKPCTIRRDPHTGHSDPHLPAVPRPHSQPG